MRRRSTRKRLATEQTGSAPASSELAEQCELFLSGAYREYLEARGRPIPAWAWINRLAHGDRADFERAAAMHNGDATAEALIAEIAAVALTRLQRGVDLETLQQNSLIPLELALAARAGVAPANSEELGRMITSALMTRLARIPRRPLCP